MLKITQLFKTMSSSNRGIFLVIALTLVSFSGSAVAELRQITIATNPQGSSYNAVGNALAKIFTEEMDIRAIAQPYGGTSAYIPLVDSGEVTVGIATSLQLGMEYMSPQGIPVDNLRIVARLWGLPYGFTVRKNSGLETVADLEGRDVVVELRANRHLQKANEAILKASGLALDEINNVPAAGLIQGVRALEDGNVAATSSGLTMGVLREADATIPGGINVLDMQGPNVSQDFFEAYAPGLTLHTVKHGVGVENEKQVAMLETVLMTSKEVGDADVKRMLEALVARWPDMKNQFGFFRSVEPKDFVLPSAITAPVHRGAVAFYKEHGLWTESAEVRHSQRQYEYRHSGE